MDHTELRHDVSYLITTGWDLRSSLLEAKLFGPDVVTLEDALLQLEQSLSILTAAAAPKA